MAVCGLQWSGMQNPELEAAVIQQQNALWALAQNALNYEVNAISYAPPPSDLASVSPVSWGDTWLEPSKPSKPEFDELDLPPFTKLTANGTINPKTVTIPSRDSPDLSTPSIDSPTNLAAEVPTEPELVIPDIAGMADFPTIAEAILTDLQVPSIIELNIPGLPSAPPSLSLDIETEEVNYSGSNYAATAELISRIQSWLNSGTGMPNAIWAMIVDKAVANETIKMLQLSAQAVDGWAARGFTYAGGPLDKQLRQLRFSLAASEQDKIGEVLGARAKEELENLQLAVAQGTVLEGQLVEAWHKERMRELTAARATVKLAVDTIEAKVALVNAQTAQYVTQAEVYSTYVRGLVLEYKRYALAVAAQEINTIYNKNATAKYVAETRALLKYSKKFAAEMRTLRVVAEYNRNLATRYRTAVSAGAQKYVAAEEAWRGWLARYELPQTDAERFRILSASFAERTRAWNAGIELEGMKVRADLVEKRARTKEIEADIGRYLEEATAKQAEIEATAQTWAQYYGTYEDYYQAWSSAVGMDEAHQRLELSKKALQLNAAIATATDALDTSLVQQRLEVERENGNAEIKANLGAAMHNIIHVASSIDASSGASSSTTCRQEIA